MDNKLLVHKHLIVRAEAVSPPMDEEFLRRWLEKFIFEEVSKNIGRPKIWLFDQLKKNNFTDWYLTADEAVESKVATNIGIPQFTFKIDTHFGYA